MMVAYGSWSIRGITYKTTSKVYFPLILSHKGLLPTMASRCGRENVVVLVAPCFSVNLQTASLDAAACRDITLAKRVNYFFVAKQ